MAVTTKDLARICGVSRATITRALNDTGRIKPETKEMIKRTAKELGYVPDLVARSLVKGNTKNLGVIVVDLKNQYFPEMINAMENRAKENSYLLNITLHENNKEIEKQLIQTLIGHRVDGILLSPANEGEAFEEFLVNLQIPVVMIGEPDNPVLPSVSINEKAATKAAAEYVISQGYCNLNFVVPPLKESGSNSNTGHRKRLAGFLEAVEKHTVSSNVIYGSDYIKKAVEIMQTAKEKPAFLCSGDMFAGNIMDKLSRRGFQAGSDYGIMGFDCLDMFQNWSPRLCTVNNHVDQIGYESADLLIRMLEGDTSRNQIEIPFNIVEGPTLPPCQPRVPKIN